MNGIVLLWRAIAAALVIVAIGGCGTTPPATRHLLGPVAVTPTGDVATSLPAGRVSHVRLSQVRLPSYVSDSAIAYLRADGTVGASPGDVWAEDPQQAITHVLGTALHEVSGVTVIYEPWPVGLDSAGTISVSIHRLLGALGGETQLSGQFLVLSAERELIVRDFDFRDAVGGTDIPALLRSYARTLRRLAEALAAALRSS